MTNWLTVQLTNLLKLSLLSNWLSHRVSCSQSVQVIIRNGLSLEHVLLPGLIASTVATACCKRAMSFACVCIRILISFVSPVCVRNMFFISSISLDRDLIKCLTSSISRSKRPMATSILPQWGLQLQCRKLNGYIKTHRCSGTELSACWGDTEASASNLVFRNTSKIDFGIPYSFNFWTARGARHRWLWHILLQFFNFLT